VHIDKHCLVVLDIYTTTLAEDK